MSQQQVSTSSTDGASFLNDISSALSRKLDIPIPATVANWILATREIASIWRIASSRASGDVFSALLGALDIKIQLTESDLSFIPERGPAMIAANHPHGILDGIVVGALIIRVRPDFRILANSILMSIPELAQYFLPISPFGHRQDVRENASALLSAFRFLKRNGAVVVFPAGEVSFLQPGSVGVADPPWNSAPFQLAVRAGAPVVPLFLHGRNGAAFHAAGFLHPSLRTILMGRELVNKRTCQLNVAIGKRSRAESLLQRSPAESALYIRHRTYALKNRTSAVQVRDAHAHKTPVAPAVQSLQLQNEVAALDASSLLYERGEYAVYIAESAQIPACLAEIGRLREVTFRIAGEGTGLASDLDRFDQYYKHLFLWNRRTAEIVGAYRIGDIAAIRRDHGLAGFYTHTLFRYDHAFLDRLTPGFELGRSFIRQEYQRQVHSLLYLWKGIGALLARQPEVRYLFGPVSISADYSAVARELLIAYFELRQDRGTGAWVRPRKAPRRSLFSPIQEVARSITSIGELSDLVADLQGDGREMPVLLRHYINLGGRVLSFNMDKHFSNVLDALVVLDLESADPATLERYTGVRRPALTALASAPV